MALSFLLPSLIHNMVPNVNPMMIVVFLSIYVAFLLLYLGAVDLGDCGGNLPSWSIPGPGCWAGVIHELGWFVVSLG